MAFLFFVFIVGPLLLLLLVFWLLSDSKVAGRILALLSLGLLGLILFLLVAQWLTRKKVLTKEDFYGQYRIDRRYFRGRQAEWQYDHFRFEISPNDSIYFYATEKDNVLAIYKGTITTVEPYHSARLQLHMHQPTHHILATNPTIYRSPWDFVLVFDSAKFGNVFFSRVEPVSKQ